MNNTPMTSGEQAKVFLFALLVLPTNLFFVGVPPMLFLLFGIVLLKKNQDFSAIETSVKLVLGYLWIGLIISIGFSIHYVIPSALRYSGAGSNELILSLVFSAVIIMYIIFTYTLYLSPLKAHRDWIALNGIFSQTSREEKKKKKHNEVKIIKGENMHSYSVADELSKWAKLKENGVVSEQEFQKARHKILQSQ